jgi:hypothetical protein
MIINFNNIFYYVLQVIGFVYPCKFILNEVLESDIILTGQYLVVLSRSVRVLLELGSILRYYLELLQTPQFSFGCVLLFDIPENLPHTILEGSITSKHPLSWVPG